MTSNLIFLDFETFYSDEYSLRKMTPAEYILDRRFEMQMCAVKVNDQPHDIVDGPDFPKWIAQFDPATTTTVTFNSLFDNSLLAWKYGFVPHTMLDAMAMARALLGHKLNRFSLAHLSEYFGLDAKGDVIHLVKGMRRAEIMASPQLWQNFKGYALRDNQNAESIFLKLYPLLPWSERRLMDMVLRCCIQPRFIVDTNLLEGHIADVIEAKEELLAAAGNVPKTDIMSTAKFKAALEALGVDIEYKESPTTGKEIPAFSKSDGFMEGLLNSGDAQVAALAAARIGLKSTLEETRSLTLYKIGQLDWASAGLPDHSMPMPLRYGGAHTHRLSGDWKMNVQNMPTVRGSKGKSKLRLSLKAPPGHTVVTIDLGQIEARLVAWLCGAARLLEEFTKYDAGDKTYDPYNRLATAIFGRPVNRKLVGTIEEVMGFIGKTGILGLGYGCGKDNFDTMIIRSARAQTMDISSIYHRAIGDKGVETYRRLYHQIPTTWNKLQNAVQMTWSTPGLLPYHLGPVIIQHGEVKLPSGMSMLYDDPYKKVVTDPKTGRLREEYFYRYGNIPHRMYGPKLLENIGQALARVIVMNAALRIRDHGRERPCPDAYHFVMQAHDELVYIIPDHELDFAKKLIHTEMVRRPSWGLDLPLVADINTGASYGEAK